jgi:hypothetical protein
VQFEVATKVKYHVRVDRIESWRLCLTEVILPDFPELSPEFGEAFRRHVHLLSRSKGMPAATTTSVLHEGNKTKMKRADDSAFDDVEINEIAAQHEISFSDVEIISLDIVIRDATKIANSVNEGMSKRAIDFMNEITS